MRVHAGRNGHAHDKGDDNAVKEEMDTYTGYLNVELEPTPTPTPTPTLTPTPTPTPTLPPITGECVFPRLITGTLTPRLEKGVVFYRVRCIIDKWKIF